MTFDEFIAGKYGVSHGAITAAAILVGTLLFGFDGNYLAAASALAFYYVREVRQGHSLNPLRWSADGQFDFFVPALVVALNNTVVLLLELSGHATH